MKKRTLAVTLFEILLASALIFVIFSGAIVLQQMGDKFYKSTSGKSSVQGEINYAMDKIVRSIREGQSVTVLKGGKDLRIVYIDGSIIEFNLDNAKKILYYSDSKKGISGEILAQNVIFNNFSLDGRSVLIRLEVKEKERSMELYSRATLRNP